MNRNSFQKPGLGGKKRLVFSLLCVTFKLGISDIWRKRETELNAFFFLRSKRKQLYTFI